MSDDQEIHVEDLSTEKKYFSQIPNIIHRMGLGCYVVAYYCLLKSIAGDRNSCFMSQKNIANLLGCSVKQIRLMNNFMSKPFQILAGKPLIKLTQRKDDSGQLLPNLVQIVDIWIENVTVLNDKIPIPKTPMHSKESKIKENFSAERSSLPRERSSLPREPGSYKEEPSIKNPVKNTDLKDLGLKTETVHKCEKKTKTWDAKRRWKLDDDQFETFTVLEGLGITDEKEELADAGKLAYWSKHHSFDRLFQAYTEAKNYKAKSIKAYMAKLLDDNKPLPNANLYANRNIAIDFLDKNPWPGAKVFKRYIKYPLGADFGEIDMNMDSSDFRYRLIEKYENSKGNT